MGRIITASGPPGGARFDMRALAAAHPSHPMGTRLRVTRTVTGRSVLVTIDDRVTINDRGPHVGDRILNPSWRAARDLGVLRPGLAMVTVQRIPEDTQPMTVAPSSRRARASPVRPQPADGSMVASGFGTAAQTGHP